MTIEESNVVDFIGVDKENGAVGLLISDHLEWDSKKFPYLRDKINTYLDYIESGQLATADPAFKDREVYIELVHHIAPNDAGKQILEKIKTVVADNDVVFTWSQFVEDPEESGEGES